MVKIGIDLTWVKPQISGGIESFARNLLDGLMSINTVNHCYVLFLSEDNYDSFKKYDGSQLFCLVKCHCRAKNVISRLVWQNFFFNRTLSVHGIGVCLTPFIAFLCRSIKVVKLLPLFMICKHFIIRNIFQK